MQKKAKTRLKQLYRNRYLNWVLKLLVFGGLSWTIYQQVFAKENADELWASFFGQLTWANVPWLILEILLIPVNWGFEALKWRELIKGFSNYSFWRTFKAILAGVTVGIFTPNRVGEYGGRVLLVEPEHNWKAVVATMVGSFSQFLVLIAFGIIGLTYFSTYFLDLDIYILYLLLSIGLVLIAVMLFCFYNIDLLIPIIRRLPYIHLVERYLKDLKVLRNYNARELSMTLFYSVCRCLVFSFQYYLVLRFFGIEVPFIEGLSGITTIYLVQTIIPLPPLVDLFARGEVALYVWGFFSVNEIGILATSFTLFILNLIIPALIGAVFIFKINIVKSLGYEKNTTV